MRRIIILTCISVIQLLLSCSCYKPVRNDIDKIKDNPIYLNSFKICNEIIENPERLYDLHYYYPHNIQEMFLTENLKDIKNITKQFIYIKDKFNKSCGSICPLLYEMDKISYKQDYKLNRKIELDSIYRIDLFRGKIIVSFCFIKENGNFYLCKVNGTYEATFGIIE